jgi:BirA family transcriptional regulator, biotin operon repressor / biotin---[acetyl-CoA-carboxylase] ligase
VSTTWRLERYPSLPSTQTVLVERASAGEPAGLVLLADTQTSGRGRAGRTWHSPAGNLSLSALLRPGGLARNAPQWSLLAGVALAEAAAPLAKGQLTLKWPNDLLIDGAKCGGILAEMALTPKGGVDWLVLGIGVNLLHAPSLGPRLTSTLGLVEAPVDFASRLLNCLSRWGERFATEGFEPVRSAWMAIGPRPGTVIHLRDGPANARYIGLAPDGALLTEIEGQRGLFHAGEMLGVGEI